MSHAADEARVGRVLVVDDEEINRLTLRALLEAEGHTALEAADGEAALAAVRAGEVDLVLLDVLMPGMDGFETCRAIRETPGQLTLPVVFVTALEDRGSRVRGKEAGGDDFLTKPVDDVELRVRVRNLLRVKAYNDLREHQQELLEAELERAREQLLRADRLATLGTLASGVGHELANAAGVFNATVKFLERSAGRGEPPSERDLANLRRVAGHLGTHAENLLGLGRPGPDFEERLDLREVVSGTLELLSISGKTKRLEVEATLPEAEVPVRVNRTRIEQVFINLVGNAADAVREAGRRPGRVTVSVAPPDPDGRIACAVEDDGPGVDAERAASVFEPYFTTKEPGRGTGLGLSVVRNIVTAYGGSIALGEADGGGARFTFDLPAA